MRSERLSITGGESEEAMLKKDTEGPEGSIAIEAVEIGAKKLQSEAIVLSEKGKLSSFDDGVIDVEAVEVPEPKVIEKAASESAEPMIEVAAESKEDPFAKGRERIASISKFVGESREKASNWFKGVGSNISKFFSGARSWGGEAVAAALSADDLAAKGARAVEKKMGEGAEWAGNKIDKADDYIHEKATAAGKWTINKIDAAADVVNGGIELGKDAAFVAKEKSVEGLKAARKGVENQYDRVTKFAGESLRSAEARIASGKEKFRQGLNNIRQRRLAAEYETVVRKHSKASQKAVELLARREDLEKKLALDKELESVPVEATA